MTMRDLTIRNLDADVIEALEMQAKENRRSLETEVRHVLTQGVERYVHLGVLQDGAQIVAEATRIKPP